MIFEIEIIKKIVEELAGIIVNEGEIVYKAGEEGLCFFIINQGECYIGNEDVKHKTIYKNECFGELALLRNCTRMYNIVAKTDSEFYVLEGTMYRELRSIYSNNKIDREIYFLEKVPWLKTLEINDKRDLAMLLKPMNFKLNDKLPREDNKFTIIHEGIISFNYHNKKIKEMTNGEYYGERWIFNDTEIYNIFDIYSEENNTKIYEISESLFQEVLGINPSERILFFFFTKMINLNKFFSNLFSGFDEKYIFRQFKFKFYTKNCEVYPVSRKENKKVVLVVEGNIIEVR